MWNKVVGIPRPQRSLSWLWVDLSLQVKVELLYRISEEIEDKGEALLNVLYSVGENLDESVLPEKSVFGFPASKDMLTSN